MATPFNNAGTLLPTLRVSMVVAAFVLLIACANVGNLLLVRSAARRQKMAIRLSVGARFSRLLKQLLIGELVLSSLAVAGGFLIAYWSRNLIVLLRPTAPGILLNLPAEIDWRVMALSAGACLVSAAILGLIPALQARNCGAGNSPFALRAESGGVVGGFRRKHVRGVLILAQVALSFVLLTSKALLVHSVRQIRTASPGFVTQNLMTSWIDFVEAGYDVPRSLDFEDELADRLRQAPGVELVAFSRARPFTYRGYPSAPIAVEGYQTQPDEQPTSDYNPVSPGYLAAMGIPLVSGREFTRADNEKAPRVALVDETMAAQYWRGRDPVGKRFQMQGRWVQVVGVAKASKYSNLLEKNKPFFYVPLRQSTRGEAVFIRAALPLDAAAKLLSREVHSLDVNLAADEVLPMRNQVDRVTWTQRAAMKLLSIFGGLALLLCAVGLYGVMSYSVSQGTRELGLRMALGARGADLLRIVMSEGMMLMAAGVIAGAVAAVSLTRLLGDLLYKTSPLDPSAFAIALAVIACVSVAACFAPAYRASQTDPVRALRDS